MNLRLPRLLSLAMLFNVGWAMATTQLNPVAVGGGNIPNVQDSIEFTMYDGNWAPTVTLPSSSPDGALVTIQNAATYSAQIMLSNTNVPLSSIVLDTGDKIAFQYNAASKTWLSYTAAPQTPSTTGSTVVIDPNDTNKIIQYKVSATAFAPTISLPATSSSKFIAITSSATMPASISAANIMYASTLSLNAGDTYYFRFDTALSKWILTKGPEQHITSQSVAGQVPTPTKPRTLVSLWDGNWARTITLPAVANDRDKITVASWATWTSRISNANVDFQGTMALRTNDRYEFLYVKEKAQWVLQSSPMVTTSAQQITGGVLPNPMTPVTEYISYDGNYTSKVTLPSMAKPGDRIQVKSDATWSFTVVSPVPGSTPTTVATGDAVRYVRTATGTWEKETQILTMLLVYSDQAAAQLGDGAMYARLFEGLRLTNDALQNSGAKMYVKAVGVLKHKVPGTTLGDVLSAGRIDTVIQTQRDALAADGVYYEGTEDGCGLAYVGPDAFSMIASGSLNCGTTVMRHELGHNFGLNHCASGTDYAGGYNVTADVMCGNAIPYYSTPDRYTAEGIPLGIVNQVDSVRKINERAPVMTAFR